MPTKQFCLLLLAVIGATTPLCANGDQTALGSHLTPVFESMALAKDQDQCIDFKGRADHIRYGLNGVGDAVIRKLFARIDIDVSAIGFATLVDELSRNGGDMEEYGSLPGEIDKKRAAKAGLTPADTDMAINEFRNIIGLVPVEVERQVYRDFVQLGLDPVADLVDARSIYECHLSNPSSTTKRDLHERISASNAARSAWQKDGFSTGTISFSKAKEQDANGSEWVRKYLREEGYRNGAALGRSDLHDVFLLVQHSGDVPLMVEALPWVANWMIEGKISGSSYALMVDRISVFKGLDQIYGTQGKGKGGDLVPNKMRDPNMVDARRSLMRMRSLKDYYRLLNN